MLPPVDDTVLQNNPKFASLYTVLTEGILNPDGTTKSYSGQKERDQVTSALKEFQIHTAKANILRTAIKYLELPRVTSTINARSTASTKNALPPELNEIIILLSNRLASSKKQSQLSTVVTLDTNTTELLEKSPQWLSIQSFAPQIGNLMSKYLQTQALALCRIANPSVDSTVNSLRLISTLVPSTLVRQKEISEKRKNLDVRRMELIGKVKMLLSLYHLASTLVILHLEQTVHGSIARELKIRSELASLTAQKLEFETKETYLKGEKIFYSEAVNKAFNKYMLSLQKGRERLLERKMKAEQSLAAYRYSISGQTSYNDEAKIMRSIADKYALLQKELVEVKRDVQKLKSER